MQITDTAKEVIIKALEEEKLNGLRLHTTRSCCGKSLQFELVDVGTEEHGEEINGITVFMDEATREWTGTVTIDAAGGELKLINTGSCCS